MNKVIFFIILLMALLGVTIGEQLYIDKTTNTMLAQIHSMQATIVNNQNQLNSDEVLDAFYDLRDYWESREGTMAFFVDHKNISNVGQCIVRLRAALEENDFTLSKTEIYLMHEVTYVFKKLSTFSIHNIF